MEFRLSVFINLICSNFIHYSSLHAEIRTVTYLHPIKADEKITVFYIIK